MEYSVIIVAAGKGQRTGLAYNKVFHEIDGKAIINYSVDVFASDEDCKQIIIVTADGEQEHFEKLVHANKVEYVLGGDTRQDSVASGLKKVNQDHVMIHDGARPYIDQQLLDQIKETLDEYDACLPMVPVTDTIKQVDADGLVISTPKREDYQAAQTPQAFSAGLIRDCHSLAKQDKFVGSDDAQLVEKYCACPIKVIPGSYKNRKITTGEDIK
ncbi:2-C-methyl-D-erythritol 4-phosphate cytidylyltransferase [Breznakia blatticola]|uniref:2-C-methyl-D-erythritol 4-phosphate cytidylyltransferase n=1 Tax=Breznakia blatticola TaxID=1754012 RepID=A0A4R7Z8M5_9FIRM|nr:2-C-methyl-D-erythritol 4-phosphate cytidylyltransferase [Breznakia blatticola]TDW11827.1 2-C-methyl-D-erythritol 4-phosphate cytidylyltransferase [Breznakia blatticola]